MLDDVLDRLFRGWEEKCGADICGISEKEMLNNLSRGIETLAPTLNISFEQAFERFVALSIKSALFSLYNIGN